MKIDFPSKHIIVTRNETKKKEDFMKSMNYLSGNLKERVEAQFDLSKEKNVITIPCNLKDSDILAAKEICKLYNENGEWGIVTYKTISDEYDINRRGLFNYIEFTFFIENTL